MFDDLDEVTSEDGEVRDPDDAPQNQPQETTANSSEDDSASITTESSPSSETTSGESPAAETSSQDQPDRETTQLVTGDFEARADPTLVNDLATRPVPGTRVNSAYPFAMRRDGWKDEREKVKFVLMEETQEREELAVEEVKEQLFPNLDNDMNVTDIREAIYIAGLMNLDDAIHTLNQWGFADLEDVRS